MRVMDLYSGIGGWHLGLRMAGISDILPFENWIPALDTQNKNMGVDFPPIDIRKLTIKNIPAKVEFIVGSPPCTQFSSSNRGGNGNIDEGLKDISKFLAIVSIVKPKYWVMENVPRLKKILEKELAPKGSLRKYKYLFKTMQIIDTSKFGVPQKRQRLLAGDFPFEIFIISFWWRWWVLHLSIPLLIG